MKLKLLLLSLTISYLAYLLRTFISSAIQINNEIATTPPLAMIPHYSTSITSTLTEVDQIRLLLLSVRPPLFPALDDREQIKVKQFTNATSNRVFKCSYQDTHVMVRVHGEGSSKLVDRAHELEFARDLGMRVNLTVPIYCTFDNGYVAGYLEGEAISLRQMSGEFSEDIADTFAKWRKTRELSHSNIPGEKRGIWKTLDEWVQIAKTFVPQEELAPAVQEIDLMWRVMRTYNNVDNQPLALCHNDLNFANMLYNEKSKNSKIFFIDYEYSGWNYPAYDLGNHFCEYGGMGKMDFSKYPDEQTRKRFLRYYLKSLNDAHVDYKIDESQLDELAMEVERYAQVSHLVWHLWALVISHTSQHTEDFDYKDYARIRMDEYLQRKEIFAEELYGTLL